MRIQGEANFFHPHSPVGEFKQVCEQVWFLRKDCENTLNISGCPRDLFKETVRKTETSLYLSLCFSVCLRMRDTEYKDRVRRCRRAEVYCLFTPQEKMLIQIRRCLFCQ